MTKGTLPEAEVTAKKSYPLEEGGRGTKEQGDREQGIEAPTALNNDDAERLLVVEEKAVGYVCDPFEVNTQTEWPEVTTNGKQHEPVESYTEKAERLVLQCILGYHVEMLKTDGTCPERFEEHIGKKVEEHGVMWKVNNVLQVMTICDWERGRWDAECFWIYHTVSKVKEYDKRYSRNVRSTELLPKLLPKGLVVQEEMLSKVIQNALDLNFKLKALKRVKTRGNVPLDEASEPCETLVDH